MSNLAARSRLKTPQTQERFRARFDRVAVLHSGLNFKLGVWDTMMGYEVFESVSNPNFTHSYGYTIEPTTHTGLGVAYQFTDWLSANAGVANTFGPRINERAFYAKAESYKAYMGSVTLTAPESLGFLKGSTLTAVVMNTRSPGISW